MPFKPEEHIIKLPRRFKNPKTDQWETLYDDYLEVKWRLVWFREQYPRGTITSEPFILDLDRDVSSATKKAKGYACFRCTVATVAGGPSATMFGTEHAADFTDFVERAETRALGRALAALGVGTQFIGQDIGELPHIVDAPVTAQRGVTTDLQELRYVNAAGEDITAPMLAERDGTGTEATAGTLPPPPPPDANPPQKPWPAARPRALPNLAVAGQTTLIRAIRAQLTWLCGKDADLKLNYAQHVWGRAIEKGEDIGKLASEELRRGLVMLEQMPKDQPPAAPQPAGAAVSPSASAPPPASSASATDADVPSYPQPAATMPGADGPPAGNKNGAPGPTPGASHGSAEPGVPPRVNLPEEPIVIDGFITYSDRRMLQLWCEANGEGDFFELFTMRHCQVTSSATGERLLTAEHWATIRKTVEAMLASGRQA